MREGGVGANVEDGVRVFAVVHAAGGEDYGNEVDAGVFQERGGGGFSEELGELTGEWTVAVRQAYLDVDIGNVAYDVVLVVHDSKGRNAFVVHQF